MNKLQTIYIPTSDSNTKLQVGSIDNNDYYKSFIKERDVKEIEAFIFTEEELKQLVYHSYDAGRCNIVNKQDCFKHFLKK